MTKSQVKQQLLLDTCLEQTHIGRKNKQVVGFQLTGSSLELTLKISLYQFNTFSIAEKDTAMRQRHSDRENIEGFYNVLLELPTNGPDEIGLEQTASRSTVNGLQGA